jgi:predicted DNA-binding transcriptional regulator YafY
MTLVFRWRSWYLFAYRREKEDYRLFRLSRIWDPELLAQRFRRREKTIDEYPKENGTWPTDNTAVAYGAVALAHILRKEAEHGGA